MADTPYSSARLNHQIANIPIPPKMQGLPLGPNGFPVPWFTPWVHGVPEFRAMDGPRIAEAIRGNLCWVCGQHRGRFMTFVIGPMCSVNRISSEPPSHLECARYSARACPFLSRPNMVRRDDSDLGDDRPAPAGFMSERNPGVTLLYTTRSCRPVRSHTNGGAGAGILFQLGDPTALEWYREGRPATRAEVLESVAGGLPFLEDLAARDPDPVGATAELRRRHAAAQLLFPTQ
jgi:hypothetical protein